MISSRDFMKFRTQKAENKYKVYNNKLTTILRQAKKDYCSKMLEENKTNLKGMWKILNKAIGNNLAFTSLPKQSPTDQ